MAQSINLIPRDEQVEQRKVKIVKLSSIISVVLLVLVALVAAYFWYSTNSLKNRIEKVDTEIASYRKDIENLSEIEITARTLDAKFRILDKIFSERRYYSVLFEEMQKRVPSAISIETFSLSGDDQENVNLAGDGVDYISIARFINTLSDENFEGAAEGLGGLFVSVALNSVTLDSQDATVKYFIVTTFDDLLLK